MQTESFVAASKDVEIFQPTNPDDWTVGQLNEQCSHDVVKHLQVGQYDCFEVNKNDAGICDLFARLGVVKKEWVKVTRLNETDFRAERVDGDCIGGTIAEEASDFYLTY